MDADIAIVAVSDRQMLRLERDATAQKLLNVCVDEAGRAIPANAWLFCFETADGNQMDQLVDGMWLFFSRRGSK
jgi:hypothetical protein